MTDADQLREYLRDRLLEDKKWCDENRDAVAEEMRGRIDLSLALLDLHTISTRTIWDEDGDNPTEGLYCLTCTQGRGCSCCVYEEDQDTNRFCQIHLRIAEAYWGRSDFNPEWKLEAEK